MYLLDNAHFRRVVCLVLLLGMMNTRVDAQDVTRSPIPDEASCRKAETKIKELFPREFENARSKPRFKKALADKLMKLAEETTDSTDRYVMLTESFELLAADAPEVGSAIPVLIKCADKLGDHFEVEPAKLKTEAIRAIASDRKTTLASVRLLDKEIISVIQQAVDHDDYESASALFSTRTSLAKRLMDKDQDAAYAKIEKDVMALASQYTMYRQSMSELEKNADSKDANRTVALYLGLRKNDWLAGERHAQLIGDDVLQDLFVRTTAESAIPEESALLANDWWNWATSQDGVEGNQAKSFAAGVYSQCASKLTGLAKKTAEDRSDFDKSLPIAVRVQQPTLQVPASPRLAVSPLDFQTASAIQSEWAKHLEVSVTYTNSLGMSFALIPPGEFVMGSPENERGHQTNETQHRVILTDHFFLGIHEVTQTQYVQIMGENPSTFVGPQLPAGDMTWNDAIEFCRRLNEIEEKAGKKYRLPTEAEWEYSCRAGTVSEHHGDSNGLQLTDIAWFRVNSNLKNHPVGQKAPNAWGLFDMHGNVWEWSLDGYQSYTSSTEDTNPIGPMDQRFPRVIRGGGAGGNFASPYEECRSAHRHVRQTNDPGTNLGFRVVMEIPKKNSDSR